MAQISRHAGIGIYLLMVSGESNLSWRVGQEPSIVKSGYSGASHMRNPNNYFNSEISA